jgi:hypothetical protein
MNTDIAKHLLFLFRQQLLSHSIWFLHLISSMVDRFPSVQLSPTNIDVFIDGLTWMYCADKNRNIVYHVDLTTFDDSIWRILISTNKQIVLNQS